MEQRNKLILVLLFVVNFNEDYKVLAAPYSSTSKYLIYLTFC